MRFPALKVLPLLLLFALMPGTRASAQGFMCDPAYENCRTPLLDLIKNETVGIDVAFWFMDDTRYASELIRRHQEGVPVRVLMDRRPWAQYGYTGTDVPVQMMADAGIPIREKTGASGILHFKMMLFAGQNVVEFSGANFSDAAFVPNTPYSNYVDEAIVFADEPSIVNSFKTRFDDVWTDVSTGSQSFANYANITGPLTRSYPTFAIDPELNFVPWQNFRSRSVSRYRAETVGIDAIMYRITDQSHTNEMIAAVGRGVPVRLIHEQLEYRNPGKLWNAWNVDRMYMAGVQVRNRGHLGLSHEKLTVLRGQTMAIIGSSNWTSASATSQHEHNLFTVRPWVYTWAADHFDRKWNNTGPAVESEPFAPLPPDTAVVKAPLDAAQSQPLSIVLKWYAGPWAHRYDVYFGESPASMTKIVDDQELGPSQNTNDHVTWSVTGLTEGTTYYWKVVSRTMADLERTSATWSFRTQGAPPAAGGDDVVLWAFRAPSAIGWDVENDATAAGGKRLTNPNLGAPKLTGALASPEQFFEMGFIAQAGVPYRIWIRGKAASNSWQNDSVFVQFSDSVTSSGAPQWRIGTTSATSVTIEDCVGCGLAGWGWNDNAVDAFGALVYFENTGAHTLRVQVREDGLMIDQIILSSNTFLTTAPGAPQSDGTIYAEQGSAPLDGNAPPTVSMTSPPADASYTAPAVIEIAASASDMDGVVAQVEFFANGTLLETDTTSPYSYTWNVSTPGSYTISARATDNQAATGTASRNVTVNAGSTLPGEEVVLYAANASTTVGWNVVPDATAAGDARLQNPNAGAPKLAAALASPDAYFDMVFDAVAGQPYHLWIRGTATGNSWANDSVFVQFDKSVTAAGAPAYRIGTTAAATVTIEDCVGCGLAGWGWNDNGFAGHGPDIYFADGGTQTIRVQVREDGLGIDQIILSPAMFLTNSPGMTKNDTTIYPAQQGGSGPPNTPPTVSLTAPNEGASFTAPAAVVIGADAADADGTVTGVDFYANGMLVGSDDSAPYSATWNVTIAGSYTLTAKATDNGGTATTSSGRTITVNPGDAVPGEETVLYASTATVRPGWNVVADATAAGEARLQNPDAGAAKLSAPLAAPVQYFEMTFDALAGRPYRVWLRGKATSNYWGNDSVFVQFDQSVTSSGTPTFRIGTTSAATVTIEDCIGCGLAGWGWNDNAMGAGVLGPAIYFANDGPQTIRIQVREDGLGIDQVVLSSTHYLNAAPGATRNDTTILSPTP
ncbi:MAG: hypothetical protein GEU82_18985 [Luteitalea sp.]|nr:hypothetical protein [Luteitalea sp.]